MRLRIDVNCRVVRKRTLPIDTMGIPPARQTDAALLFDASAERGADANIVVAGGAGIHSQFVPTSFSYNPVSRLIRFKR